MTDAAEPTTPVARRGESGRSPDGAADGVEERTQTAARRAVPHAAASPHDDIETTDISPRREIDRTATAARRDTAVASAARTAPATTVAGAAASKTAAVRTPSTRTRGTTDAGAMPGGRSAVVPEPRGDAYTARAPHPVIVARTAPPARSAQPVADGAAIEAERRSRARRAVVAGVLVTAALGLVATVALVLLLVG